MQGNVWSTLYSSAHLILTTSYMVITSPNITDQKKMGTE